MPRFALYSPLNSLPTVGGACAVLRQSLYRLPSWMPPGVVARARAGPPAQVHGAECARAGADAGACGWRTRCGRPANFLGIRSDRLLAPSMRTARGTPGVLLRAVGVPKFDVAPGIEGRLDGCRSCTLHLRGQLRASSASPYICNCTSDVQQPMLLPGPGFDMEPDTC